MQIIIKDSPMHCVQARLADHFAVPFFYTGHVYLRIQVTPDNVNWVDFMTVVAPDPTHDEGKFREQYEEARGRAEVAVEAMNTLFDTTE